VYSQLGKKYRHKKYLRQQAEKLDDRGSKLIGRTRSDYRGGKRDAYNRIYLEEPERPKNNFIPRRLTDSEVSIDNMFNLPDNFENK